MEMGVLGGADDVAEPGVFSLALANGEAPSVRGLVGEAMYEYPKRSIESESHDKLGTPHCPASGVWRIASSRLSGASDQCEGTGRLQTASV